MTPTSTSTTNGTVRRRDGTGLSSDVREPRPLAIPYTTSWGEKRQAILGVDDTGVWFVYDTPAARTGRIVARLGGADEELPEAMLLAADYVEQQIAYATGERLEDPSPKTEQRRLSEIRADCERAAERTAEHPDLERFRRLKATLVRSQAASTATANTTEGKS